MPETQYERAVFFNINISLRLLNKKKYEKKIKRAIASLQNATNATNLKKKISYLIFFNILHGINLKLKKKQKTIIYIIKGVQNLRFININR